MNEPTLPIYASQTVHAWLRRLSVAHAPGATTPLLEQFAKELLECMRSLGHEVLPAPQDGLDVLLTTATFGEALNWRQALLFTARPRFGLARAPLLFTLLHATPAQFQEKLAHFEQALSKPAPDSADFDFPGLAPSAYLTLYEQGRRGGPILSLVRLLQAQAKSIRILLVVGEEEPVEAYTFDLVGAYARSEAGDRSGAGERQAFYRDLAQRIVTAASTHEVTDHRVEPEPISQEMWSGLTTPPAMRRAGLELGKRRFFTEMVRVESLVHVPAVHESVSSQYSEGCFATWDARLGALIATITGSARPVEKDRLSDDELAVISGVREDGRGACVRQVEGKRNDPPSSEAVELMAMDSLLPRIVLGKEWGVQASVPVARSKLHGHRGVRAYDPSAAEHVYLDPAFYFYPVSCSTEAQARAICAAFARSETLRNPADPRPVAFTVLPGHGLVMVEKWVAGKEPFQVMWELMDGGQIEIDNHVPQGPLAYLPTERGKMALCER